MYDDFAGISAETARADDRHSRLHGLMRAIPGPSRAQTDISKRKLRRRGTENVAFARGYLRSVTSYFDG